MPISSLSPVRSTKQNREVIQNIYNQMPDPKVVVAVGICACSGGVFRECYNVAGGIDKLIPVDVYVPGLCCPPRIDHRRDCHGAWASLKRNGAKNVLSPWSPITGIQAHHKHAEGGAQ